MNNSCLSNAVSDVDRIFDKEKPYQAMLTLARNYRLKNKEEREALFMAVLAAYTTSLAKDGDL